MPKDTKNAALYRMVMPEHTCPYGLKSKHLLESNGYDVKDHHLKNREETDAFMQEHDIETTPQTFIDGDRIGGHDELRIFLGIDPPKDKQSDTSYRPVVAIFSVCALLALGLAWHQYGTVLTWQSVVWFISLSMTVLAIQKLQDVEQFSTMFLNYDLLAKHWVPYGKVYPYGEALAGILMTAGILPWVSAPVALFIGTIGAVSVVKAVYIDNRELKCACVGGASNVPLGFISLTENLMMMLMGVWMGLRALGV